MATISKNWASQSQIIGTGDGYVTLSGTTESFSSDVDLETNGYEGAHIIIEINYDATPADEVKLLSKTLHTSELAFNKQVQQTATMSVPMSNRGIIHPHRTEGD
jgi:hypothetical protein